MEFARDMKPGAPKPPLQGAARWLMDGGDTKNGRFTIRGPSRRVRLRPKPRRYTVAPAVCVCSRGASLECRFCTQPRVPARACIVRARAVVWRFGFVDCVWCVCDARLGAYCVWYSFREREHRKKERRALELTCNL